MPRYKTPYKKNATIRPIYIESSPFTKRKNSIKKTNKFIKWLNNYIRRVTNKQEDTQRRKKIKTKKNRIEKYWSDIYGASNNYNGDFTLRSSIRLDNRNRLKLHWFNCCRKKRTSLGKRNGYNMKRGGKYKNKRKTWSHVPSYKLSSFSWRAKRGTRRKAQGQNHTDFKMLVTSRNFRQNHYLKAVRRLVKYLEKGNSNIIRIKKQKNVQEEPTIITIMPYSRKKFEKYESKTVVLLNSGIPNCKKIKLKKNCKVVCKKEADIKIICEKNQNVRSKNKKIQKIDVTRPKERKTFNKSVFAKKFIIMPYFYQ